jgi:uncharacterized protein DUF6174
MRTRLVVVVAVALAAAGCSSSGGESAAEETVQSQWREPANYSYTLDSRCGEQAVLGRYRITVANGVVADVKPLDQAATDSGAMNNRDSVPTMSRLLEYVDIARGAGADVATAEFDPADGHPTKVSIDQKKSAADDELCYTTSDYALPSASPGP